MARTFASRNITPAFAMIIIAMHIAHTEGTCVVEPDYQDPAGLFYKYPYGPYVYTCDDGAGFLGTHKKPGHMAASCRRPQRDGGGTIYTSFQLEACCITCLDPSDQYYNNPSFYEYALKNDNGVLS